jgi:hypothetical protein
LEGVFPVRLKLPVAAVLAPGSGFSSRLLTWSYVQDRLTEEVVDIQVEPSLSEGVTGFTSSLLALWTNKSESSLAQRLALVCTEF